MNDFQKWLVAQGYHRQNSNGAWMKGQELVSGKELNEKLKEFKSKQS